ncbi:DUF4126 domain-containing protein [Methylophaga sp.]|uniref:DUF4126 domain-containing protein n=1 Tax=Methylophaga sp. TaxID=2024840 RepID=UPI001400F7F5|nr:DUF4126 domain-containing protein [Methylophaga sp.]MTI63716.1 DUF4126 domain-containing protein [Methylophaga sp.]
MEAVNIIALSMGAAWASGINLYATIFMLGYMGLTGNIVLPEELQVLSDPLVMTAAGFMYCVEFFADKMPGVDTGWDSLHTFIRIPAGAMLAASAVGDVTPAVELSAALLGGTLAAGSHATKAGSRLLINTSPEPVSNWGASITEDLLVIGGLWTALNHPLLFLIALVAFVVLMIWLLPRLWRLIKELFRRVGSWLGLCQPPAPPEPPPAQADPTQIENSPDKRW